MDEKGKKGYISISRSVQKKKKSKSISPKKKKLVSVSSHGQLIAFFRDARGYPAACKYSEGKPEW